MGGAEHSVLAALPGRLFAFRGSMTCDSGRALNERGTRSYSNILAALLVYAVSQLRSSSVKGSVDFRVA
jgi:hypothetical protein